MAFWRSGRAAHVYDNDDGRIRRVPQGKLCLLQVPATLSNMPDPEAKVFPPKPSKFEVCQSYLVKTQ